jgi:hypothetical protein
MLADEQHLSHLSVPTDKWLPLRCPLVLQKNFSLFYLNEIVPDRF